MKRFKYLFSPRGEQGSIAPVVALGLVAFVGAMALGVDLGQLQVVKNELQNVADAAALAGAKKLIQDKDGDGVAEVYCAEAIQTAKDYVKKNYSLGSSTPLEITDADVTIGLWDLNLKKFTSTGCSTSTKATDVNAVQVTVNRDGGSNDKVSTFLGDALGVGTKDKDPETGIESGPAKLTAAASSVAMLGLAGTSSADVPFSVPADYLPGGGIASNGLQRIMEKFTPPPAYAADPQTYRWKDLGGSSLVTNRAAMVVAESSQLSLTWLQYYLKGADISGGKRFPQKKVGDKLYGISEYLWGSNVKSNFTILKTRWTNKKSATTGKWRVTVPVFKTTPVTASLPQDSWFKLASRLLPGVSQAHACAAYTSPAIYTQGFATIDITNVYVKSDCLTSGDQVSQTNSCRNTCYMDIEVPLTQNTVSTDKGSTPIPFQKDYKDMNTTATEVGVFASVPRLVK